MFRKILFSLLVFTSVASYAQICPGGVDVKSFDITIPRANLMEYHADVESGPDQYLVCMDKKVTVTPTLKVDYLNETDTYTVESIEYKPYPYFGGTEVTVNIDARAQQDIELPFEFCFFGEKYKLLSVHSNGVINFTDGTTFKGNVGDTWVNTPNCHDANGNLVASSTDPVNPLPKGGVGSPADPGWLNSVCGVAHHYHQASPGNNGNPNANPPILASSINYAEYGTAPDRVFVVSFGAMPSYNLTAALCLAIPPNTQTSQVVFYETTNVIEVNVLNHNGCPFDCRGRSIIGINNATGTIAFTPPGRNSQHFDKAEESWRFGPAGDPLWRLEWYANGQYVGNGFTQDVVIESETEICANLIIDGCAETLTDRSGVIFRPDIDLEDLEIDQQIVCDKNQNTFNLLELNQIVIDHQGGSTGNLLTFLYYNNEEDATNKKDRITQPREFPINMGETPVWMRIEGRLSDCFEIVPVTILKVPVEVKTPKDVNLCTEYILPKLTDDEFYYKLERLDEDAKFVIETLPQPNENQLINKVGYYRVSIKKTNEYGCDDVKSFILFVENCSYPKGISPNGDGDNDYLDLTYNNVQELKIFNRYGKVVFEHGKGYKRQWHGQDASGKILPSGTYFLNVKTKDYEYQDWIQLMYELK